jgi:hypothetical protein
MNPKHLNPEHLNPEHLNIAYDELMTWGPRLGEPLLPRILERIPEISFEMAIELEVECGKAQRLVNEFCERAYAGELAQSQVQKLLLEQFAWVNAVNLSHAISQGMYFAWHG